MGKETKLLYKASRDGFSSEVFWEKCLGQKETIALVQTDLNSVIGGYCPDQWEDTTGKKDSRGVSDSKDIVSGKPFLFYFLDDQIEIIKHRDDVIPWMKSYKDCLVGFGNGFLINSGEESYAVANNEVWVWPENTGNLIRDDAGLLYFAGGDDFSFTTVDIEVWGLH